MTKRVHWKGDFCNAPKSGTAVFQASGMVSIIWDDGTKNLVPAFTIKEQYGWRVE